MTVGGLTLHVPAFTPTRAALIGVALGWTQL